MKTLESIKEEIAAAPPKKEEHDALIYEKLYRKAQIQVGFLKQVQFYLETEPREEFVRASIAKIENKLLALPNSLEDWKFNQPPHARSEQEWRSLYDKAMGVPELNRQLKTLRYILDENN